MHVFHCQALNSSVKTHDFHRQALEYSVKNACFSLAGLRIRCKKGLGFSVGLGGRGKIQKTFNCKALGLSENKHD